MPGQEPEGRALKHVGGLLLFPVIGLGVSIVWLIIVTQILGLGKEGFGFAGVLIAIPIYAFGFGLLVWLPVWLIHDRKFGVMSPLRSILIGLIAGFILAILLAGLRSFGPAPGAQYFGWAILAVTSIGAWAHNKILNR